MAEIFASRGWRHQYLSLTAYVPAWKNSIPFGRQNDAGKPVEAAMTPDAIDLSAAALVTDEGPIFLEFAVIPVIDVERVWQGLVDLSTAAAGEPATGLARGMTAAEAYDAWSLTTLGLNGYLRAIDAGAAGNVLDSATGYAEFTGSLTGMDSVYLAAFSSASRELSLTGGSLDRAAEFLDEYGLPDAPSGGTAHTFVNDVAHNNAALVNHSDLKSKLEQTHGNVPAILDVLAREGVGLAAGASRSLIPGSGPYVKGAGDVLVSTSEGVAWGGAIGSFFGGVGATVGAIVGGVVGLVAGIASLVTGSHATSEVAKGDKVPVSPPAPVTDQQGKTTNVGPTGQTSPGRPTSSPSAPPPPTTPPGPKAKEVHCPRGDDEVTPELDLPGWRTQFDLVPVLGPNGPGFDGLVTGETAVHLVPAAQLSLNAEVTTAGIWGDLLVKTSAGPGRTDGLSRVDLGRLAVVVEASRRIQLAEALARNVDHSAMLEDALAALRRDRAMRRSRRLR
jgi:hypothetical protein